MVSINIELDIDFKSIYDCSKCEKAKSNKRQNRLAIEILEFKKKLKMQNKQITYDDKKYIKKNK